MFEETLGERHPKLVPTVETEQNVQAPDEKPEHSKLVPMQEETESKKVPNFAAIAVRCFLPKELQDIILKETGE